MPDNNAQDMDQNSFPMLSGEELIAGVLAEIMEDAGVDPLGRASESDPDLPNRVIPPWFRRLSGDI